MDNPSKPIQNQNREHSDRPNTQVLQRLRIAWVRFTVESLAGRYRSRF